MIKQKKSKNLLEKYRKKRNFSKTSEPKGKVLKSKNFRFVIQKHDATRLHFDFRIEHEGVLKSWAVPKGLPYQNSDKRLAVHVEDHPLHYFDFEGNIAEGNYGAGSVIVWDSGNYWVPHAENSQQVNEKISEGFKKGEIKLILNGRKVKGLFALVRFKKAGKESWLFIKDKDEFDGKDFYKNDKSVKSGKSLETLKLQNSKTLKQEKVDEVAKSSSKIRPMLATLGEDAFDNSDFIFEEKLDGYRVIAELSGSEVNLFSRRGENYNKKFPEILESLEKLNLKAILDGEIVAYQDGKASFQAIQNAGEKGIKLKYHIFDILSLNNLDTTKLPLIERKKFLKKIIPAKNSKILLTKFIKEKGKEFFKKTLKTSEGIMAKRIDSKYFPGERSDDWIKIKNTKRQEFVIGGITLPKDGKNGFGSLIVGVYKRKKLVYVGHIGTGFSSKLMETLMKSFKKLKRNTSPFSNFDNKKNLQFWMEPVLICEASFAEWTNDNMIRQASFLGLRTDKLASQVNLESSQKLSKSKKGSAVRRPVLRSFSEGGSSNTTRKELNHSASEGGDSDSETSLSNLKSKNESLISELISNPQKIFFPEKKYTKFDLAKFYSEISPILLPYLKDRPQNLNRHPNGYKGMNFYQKDIEFELPDFVKTVDIKRPEPKKDKSKSGIDKEITYILCQNVETLLFMSNLGCIEINPWLSRAKNLDKPDFMIFDIDPNNVEFPKVVEVAKKLYEMLEEIGIHPIIKTSGKRGLHLYTNLGGKYSYEESRSFAKAIAQIMLTKFPNLISLERSPSKRKGKIYIDYLQNRQGQTTASVYSVRPTKDASVSTPLDYEELNAKLDPKDFTIKNVMKRIERKGDLWASLFENEVDLQNAISKLRELK